MKSILFYSPDFSMCYSLLMYLQDKFNVTTTTDIDIVRSLTKNPAFDIILIDAEPSADLESICKTIKDSGKSIPVILTYVYQNHMKDMDTTIRRYVNSVFYKPFDLNEVSKSLTSLAF
ncbi:MAG: hypothetical protein R6W90_16125 [Ignavibacteriaceae bacterium]